MPKTPQQWKDTLDLAELPDPDYLAALNALEGVETIDAPEHALHLQEMTPDDLLAALIVEGAGQAFRSIRAQAGLTTRRAGSILGVSGARVSQLEADEANLYTSTVAEVAARFGYRAKLVLEPLGGGQRIEATLKPR